MIIVLWVIIGAITGLLSRIAMPVAADRGNMVAAAVGISSAIAGGLAGTAWARASLLEINSVAFGAALVSALYVLFAYRCLALRTRGA